MAGANGADDVCHFILQQSNILARFGSKFIGVIVPAYRLPYGLSTLFFGLFAGHIGRSRIMYFSWLLYRPDSRTLLSSQYLLAIRRRTIHIDPCKDCRVRGVLVHPYALRSCRWRSMPSSAVQRAVAACSVAPKASSARLESRASSAQRASRHTRAW